MTAYVGIDLHRRRSLAVSLDEEGERLWWKRFENSPRAMAEVVAEAGPDPEVVLEATVGLVLGSGCDCRGWGAGAFGASVGDQRFREPAGEERPQGRRDVGGSVAHGPVTGVVDPAGVGAGVAGAGPRSKRCPATTVAPRSGSRIGEWLNAGAATSAGWLRPASCSLSSTTG